MKYRIASFIFSLLLTTGLLAQSSARSTSGTAANSSVFSSVNDVQKVSQNILDIVGLKANFDLREANIPNAAAVNYNGKRYILYNPNFMKQLEKTTGTKWAGISVLAHEIGHHLNGHTMSGQGSSPDLELEADEFSGFVLRKMGATEDQAGAAMRTLATNEASRTHPARDNRLYAINEGWEKADAQLAGRTYVAKAKPVPVTTTVASVNTPAITQQAVFDPRSIVALVSFKADASSEFFITKRLNLVRVKDNQASVIGKLASLESDRFPFVIYDESNTQLLVDTAGNIVNKNGYAIGMMTAM